MGTIRIIDVTDAATFGLIPPCADPGFDHRSCDYWEDEVRGSKAARLSWFTPSASGAASSPPFATPRPANPFLTPGDDDATGPVDNPFAPPPVERPTVGSEAPRKLALLG